MVVAALLGGAIGGLALGSDSAYAATAIVQAAPAELGVDLGGGADDYVQQELVRIDVYEDQLVASAIESTGAQEPVEVLISVLSGTSFIAFQAIAGSAGDAAAVANASAQFYIDEWRARTIQTLELSLDIVDEQLSQTRSGTPAAQDLTSTEATLNTQLAVVEAAERFVSPASQDSALLSSSRVGGILLGVFAGLVLGAFAVLLLYRRRIADGFGGS